MTVDSRTLAEVCEALRKAQNERPWTSPPATGPYAMAADFLEAKFGPTKLTEAEALRLVNYSRSVRVRRNGSSWEGRAAGFVDRPSLLIEHHDGSRTAVAIDGATVEELP